MAWNQLIDMIQEARQIDQEDATKVPVECPYDYTTLRDGPDGTLFCPWGCGYEYPRDA